MEILNFDYENYHYFMESNNGKIDYKKVDNNGNVVEVSEEDISLIKNVLNKVFISTNNRNHIKCGKIFHNDSYYQVFYDIKTKTKFFSLISEDGKNTLSTDDYVKLDSILNPLVYNDSKHKNSSGLIKRIVSLGTAVIIVTTSAVSYLKSIKPDPNVSISYTNISLDDSTISLNSDEFIVEEALDLNQFYQNFENTINSNKNLTEVKEIIIEEGNLLFEDNGSYLNKEVANRIISRLERLEIIYNPDTITKENSFGTSTKNGEYSDVTGNITIFGNKSLKEYIKSDPEMRTLKGEFVHLLFSPNVGDNSLGYSIQEALTHIIVDEYLDGDFGINSSSYSKWRSCTYMLIELLGTEKIKEYYFGGGVINILRNALEELGLNENEAIELIGEIDNIEYTFEEVIAKVASENDGWFFLSDGQSAFDKFNQLYMKAYKEKYRCKPESNPVVDAYYYSQTNAICRTADVLGMLKSKNSDGAESIATIGTDIVYPLKYFNEMFDKNDTNVVKIHTLYCPVNPNNPKESNSTDPIESIFIIADSSESKVLNQPNTLKN